jgi:hypothetical protein
MTEYVKFTKSAINTLPLPEKGKRSAYYHPKMKGLMVRVTSSGTKTFYVMRWMQGGPEWASLGKFPEMTPEQAEREADKYNGAVASGSNPNEAKRRLRGEIILFHLFDDFLLNKRNRNGAPLAEKTKTDYRKSFDQLDNLKNRQLSLVKRDELKRLHEKLGKEHPIMANRILALTSSLFSYAIDKELFTGTNPASGIKKFPEHARDRFLQSDELPQFFQALADEPNEIIRDYFSVSLLTGARKSNVLSMRCVFQ